MHIVALKNELRRNILRDVSDLVDPSDEELQASYLWTDDTLVRYINQGYYRMAERGYLLRDSSTAEVCEVELVEGQEEYTLHEAILSVYTARIGRQTLQRLSSPTLTGNERDIAYARPYELEARTGMPRYFTTDEADYTLRVYPAPDAEYAGKVLSLRVARLPLAQMELPASGDNEADYDTPEIPSQYHMDILDWAAWLALRNHDTDGENLNKARSHRNAFIARTEEAKQQHKMLMFQPPQFAFNARWH